MELYAIKIDKNLDNTKYTKLLSLISKDKAKKIERFMFYDDKLRSLLGECLLIVALKNKYKLEEINILYNEYGKPYIEKNLQFNISHSGNWVVVAIDNKPIGIDIEKIQPIEYNEMIKYILCKDEYIYIYTAKNKLEEFYRLWTLKESYVKMVGKGLSIPLTSFKVKKSKYNEIWKTESDYYKKNIYYNSYNIDKEYIVSVCSVGNKFLNYINILDINYIEQYL